MLCYGIRPNNITILRTPETAIEDLSITFSNTRGDFDNRRIK